MPTLPDSKPFLALLAIVVAFSFFTGLGSTPLFDEDEGTYAEVTREMLQSGDFLTPRLNGELFFHKPPLIYWAQAASVSLLGLSEFALRLPCALASALWALVLFGFARRYFNTATAWYAAFFLATSIQTAIVSKAALADAYLNLFLTLSMFCIYAYYRHRRRRDIYLTFGSMALGFLAKGPIAVLIPLVVSGIFFGLKGRWRDWFKAIFNPLGWSLLLFMVLPWYAAQYRLHGSVFIEEIFFTQNVARFRTAFEGHAGAIFFYLPVILLGMIPHTAFVLKAVARSRQLLRHDINQYLALWFLFVLIFFSLAATKLHHYIIYGYVPLFLHMGQAVDAVRSRFNQLSWPLGFVTVLFGLPQIAGVMQPHIQDEFAALVIAGALESFTWEYHIGVGSAGLLLLGLLVYKPVSPLIRTVTAGIIMVAVTNFCAVPVAAAILQQPVKEAALLARAKGYTVHMWQMSYPSFRVYHRGRVIKGAPGKGDIVITKVNKLKSIQHYQILYQKHGIVLARILEF